MRTCETCFKTTNTGYCDEKKSAIFGRFAPRDFGCIHHEEKPEEPDITLEEAIKVVGDLRSVKYTERVNTAIYIAIHALEEMKSRAKDGTLRQMLRQTLVNNGIDPKKVLGYRTWKDVTLGEIHDKYPDAQLNLNDRWGPHPLQGVGAKIAMDERDTKVS